MIGQSYSSHANNTFATGDVLGTSGSFVGGFVGFTWYSNFSYCYTDVDVTGGAGSNMGGFVGGMSRTGINKSDIIYFFL